MSIIYKFETPNCGPCAALEKFIEQNPNVFEGFTIKRVDIFSEEGQEVAGKHRIRSSPTMVFVNSDGEVETFVGFSQDKSPEKLIEWVRGLK